MRFSLRHLKAGLATLGGAAWMAAGLYAPAAMAQGSTTVPAFLISDIHFDPLHDPGKVKQLAAAPVTEWKGILSAAASANQQQAFEALQQSCHARGVDTSFALLESSLQAMRARQADAKFVTVSGDLVVHAFPCRYHALMPGAGPAEYEAFVLKTIDFVMRELRGAFPEIPVYATLGNNDSGCGDYQMDAKGLFLAQAGKSLGGDLPLALQQAAMSQMAEEGNYSVTMAAPMKGTRLIALNDLFLSTKYRSCAGKVDEATPVAELAWLRQQLDEARKAGQKVWVMGHIPPGIDPYSTLTKLRNVCAGEEPVTFLSSDGLAETLAAYGDVIRLGIFAHTHMDEVRLLTAEGSGGQSAVAVKMVASISPVNGNNPSFTVARVDPATAEVVDYAVITASNQTGVGATWSEEYDFGKTFHAAEFSAPILAKLIEGFKADRGATTAESQAYLHHYFVGDRAAELSLFWPQYVCSLSQMSTKAYVSCLCGDGKQ